MCLEREFSALVCPEGLIPSARRANAASTLEKARGRGFERTGKQTPLALLVLEVDVTVSLRVMNYEPFAKINVKA